MADQGRWSDERGRSGGDYGRYRRDFDAYGRRDGGGQELGAMDDDRYGERYGEGFRSSRYGTEDYGVPSDYYYRGRSSPGAYRSDAYGSAGYGLSGDYNQSLGRNLGSQSLGGQNLGDRGYGLNYGRSFSDGRYGGDYRGSYERDYADQHAMAGRPQEDRSFWSQTRDEVSSWFGDDEARRRRQMDELRAGEHRGRGPKGYTRSDDRIREDVNDRLTDHGRLDASDIDVKVSNAEVTLSGTVHRREDKRLAEDIADQISGVKHVQNNLRVKEASTTAAAGSAAQTGARTQTLTN